MLAWRRIWSCTWSVWRSIKFGEELLELAGIEVGEDMAIDNDGGHVGLTGKTLHLLVGSGVATHVDFPEGDTMRF